MPWLWIPPRGKLERKDVFSSCYGDEATTYYDRDFFLKLQRDNRKNALTVDPSRGKLEKKLYFYRTVEMEQPHTIAEPYSLFA